MDLQFRAHLLPNTVDECASAFAVNQSHLSDVAGEVSFTHEVAESFLMEVGWKYVHRRANGNEVFYQILWNHDVAKTQGGKEDFTEGSDIDDPIIPIEALQGGNRRAFEAILTVVVVLDDPGAGALRPVQQLHATPCAHRRTEWVLMRRANVGSAGFRGSLDSGRYDHAILVDWNRHQAATCAFKGSSSQGVTWLLD